MNEPSERTTGDVAEFTQDMGIDYLGVIDGDATLQLDNLGLLDVNISQVVNFWPLLLIGFGAKILLRPKGKDNSVIGIILITIGAYFQAHNLGVIEFGIDQLWPIAVIAAGVGMLRKAMARS